MSGEATLESIYDRSHNSDWTAGRDITIDKRITHEEHHHYAAKKTELSEAQKKCLPARDAYYVGREMLFKEIQTQFQKAIKGRYSTYIGLKGVGGIGKTGAAIEYAHIHYDDYDYIFHLAVDDNKVATSFKELAERLGIPTSTEEQIKNGVKNWLIKTPNWLLILDNVDSNISSQYLPSSYCDGHHLLTSQNSNCFGPDCEIFWLDVGTLNRNEEMIYAKRKLSQARLAGADALLDKGHGLPIVMRLLVAQAINSPYRSLDRIAEQFEVLSYVEGSDNYKVIGSISKKSIELLNEYELSMIQICSLLHPDDIEIDLVYQMYNHVHLNKVGLADIDLDVEKSLSLCERPFVSKLKELRHNNVTSTTSIHSDNLKLDIYLDKLMQLSLVSANNSKALKMHRTLQKVIHDAMSAEVKRKLIESIADTFRELMPDGYVSDYHKIKGYLPHLLLLSNTILSTSYLVGNTSKFMSEAIEMLYYHSQYSSIIDLCTQWLSITYKENDWQTNFTYFYLARALKAQGNYKDSLEIALKVREMFANIDDELFVAHTDNMIGSIYSDAEDYRKAQTVVLNALERYEKLGQEYAEDQAYTKYLIGYIYIRQDMIKEAKEATEQSIQLYTNEVGPNSLKMSKSYQLLAMILGSEQDYAKAIDLFEKSICILTKNMADQTREMANYLQDYGELYEKMNDMGRAEEYLQKGYMIFQQVLGDMHPDTLECKATLNRIQQKMKNDKSGVSDV